MTVRVTSEESGRGSWAEYYRDLDTLPRILEYFNNMGEFIAKCREHFAGCNILEVGTGSGLMAIYFSQMNYSVTGLDRDPDVIASNQRMNAMLGGSVRFVVGDILRLPFRENAFDACYHQGLMEHFDPPEIVAALKAQTAVCRRVIFAVPTIRWKGGVYGDERMWTGQRWLDLLAPFRVIDIFGMAYNSLPTRGCNMLGRRLTSHRPAWLYRKLALRSADEIGFVIEAGGRESGGRSAESC